MMNLLPHADASLIALVPGAVLVALGVQAMRDPAWALLHCSSHHRLRVPQRGALGAKAEHRGHGAVMAMLRR
jgi:hypothetical protein